jgi:uncharacterized SAM-binding protein YcdF (DUF218 family)
VLLALKAFVKAFLLPPVGPLLLTLFGLVVARWRARVGRVLVLIGIGGLTLLCMPAVGAFLVRCLDHSRPLNVASNTGAQAIVILGGGIRSHAPEYGGATLNTVTLERVRYGAYLARVTNLPILISGGASSNGAWTEAWLMRHVLVGEYQVPVRWVEARSRNTHENAIYSAAILNANGIHRVILVGHSFDFPRSRAEFEAAGIEAVPAPMGLSPTRVDDFVPSAEGLALSRYAVYEIYANVLFFLMH